MNFHVPLVSAFKQHGTQRRERFSFLQKKRINVNYQFHSLHQGLKTITDTCSSLYKANTDKVSVLQDLVAQLMSTAPQAALYLL